LRQVTWGKGEWRKWGGKGKVPEGDSREGSRAKREENSHQNRKRTNNPIFLRGDILAEGGGRSRGPVEGVSRSTRKGENWR